MVTKVNAIVLI